MGHWVSEPMTTIEPLTLTLSLLIASAETSHPDHVSTASNYSPCFPRAHPSFLRDAATWLLKAPDSFQDHLLIPQLPTSSGGRSKSSSTSHPPPSSCPLPRASSPKPSPASTKPSARCNRTRVRTCWRGETHPHTPLH